MPIISSKSAQQRAIGPITDSFGAVGGGWSAGARAPVSSTTPREGLCDTMPQKCAGTRKLPAMSPPSSTGVIPAASAPAEPPLLPPVVRVTSHGLLLVP